MTDQTRRTFLKQAALGTAAVLAYPSARALGANDRIRVGMIGVGDRGNDLLDQIRKVPNVDLVAMADIYSRRRDQAKSKSGWNCDLDEFHDRLHRATPYTPGATHELLILQALCQPEHHANTSKQRT